MNHCDCNQGRLPCTCKPRAIGKAPELAAAYGSFIPVEGDIYAAAATSLCECSDDAACACGSPNPAEWVPCSPAWLKAGGDCATAPRLAGKPGSGISHYHPPHAEQQFAARFERAFLKPGELMSGVGLVKDNSSLFFDVALAAYHKAVWNAAEGDESSIAYDEAGLIEAKVLIGLYREAATLLAPNQDEFEADYADYTGRDIENIKAQRLPNNTYGQPKIANAWRWYQRGRGVEL